MYPVALSRAICEGLNEQKRLDAMGLFQIWSANDDDDDSWGDSVSQSQELHEEIEWEQAWDDVSGEEFDPTFAKQARKEEIEY